MKTLLVVTLCLAITACNPVQTNVRLSQIPMKTEEYAVYSDLLQAEYVDKRQPALLVIENLISGTDPEYKRQSLADSPKDPPDLTTDLVADYPAINADAQVLEPRLTLSIKYTLAPPIEAPARIGDNSYWRAFYEKYPEAKYIVTLSRVGFNAAMDTALVSVSEMSGTLAGDGATLILKKINGVWKVAATVSEIVY